MNVIYMWLKDLNGWKTVIAIIGSVFTSYLGIKNEVETNRNDFAKYTIQQKERDDNQDKAVDKLGDQVQHGLERLGDKIDAVNGVGRPRAK